MSKKREKPDKLKPFNASDKNVFVLATWITLILFVLINSVQGFSKAERLFVEPVDQGTDLVKCPLYAEGIKYRIPPRLDCSNPNMSEIGEFRETTTYWPDYLNTPIDGYECYRESQTFSVNKQFFGQITRGQSEKTYSHLSESACREMRKSQLTPGGEMLQSLRTGLQGTTNHGIPDASWMRTIEQTNINYYVNEVVMTIDNDNDQVIPAGADPTRTCKLNEGYCPTSRGVLIWDRHQRRMCRLKVGKTDGCLQNGKHMSCPATHLVLMKWKKTKVCGVDVLVSSQDVAFTTSLENELEIGVIGTAGMLRHIRALNQASERFKRNADWEKEYKVSLITKAEFDTSMQWLYDAVKKQINTDLWTIHSQTCNAARMVTDLAQHFLEKGDATAYVRTMTGDDSLRATLEGDAINVYACEPVKKYYFNRRVNCTAEYPVTYILGERRYQGYLLPGKSREIVDVPTEVECPPRPFYFESKFGLINLDNKTMVNDMKTMVNPGASKGPDGMGSITFSGGGNYLADEFTGRKMFLAMLQSINKGSALDRFVARKQMGQTPTQSETNAADYVGDYVTQGLFTKITYVFIGLAILGAVVGLVFVNVYIKPIKAGGRAFFGCLRTTKRGLSKCCKKKKKAGHKKKTGHKKDRENDEVKIRRRNSISSIREFDSNGKRGFDSNGKNNFRRPVRSEEIEMDQKLGSKCLKAPTEMKRWSLAAPESHYEFSELPEDIRLSRVRYPNISSEFAPYSAPTAPNYFEENF